MGHGMRGGLSSEQILAAIRQCVAVVDRSQMLIVRLDPGDDSWEAVAGQLAEASAASGVAMMLVIAPQIAVASVEEPWSIGDLTSD